MSGECPVDRGLCEVCPGPCDRPPLGEITLDVPATLDALEAGVKAAREALADEAEGLFTVRVHEILRRGCELEALVRWW